MNLEYNYWYFEKAFTKEFCEKVIKLAKKKKLNRASIVDLHGKKRLSKKDKKDLASYRDSNIVWMDELWIYKEIEKFMKSANAQAGWNFQVDCAQSIQFTIYKKGQYYNWHADSTGKPIDAPNDTSHGKIRKLSCSVLLSDPKDYEGGELQFITRNRKDAEKNTIKTFEETKDQGAVVFFPSFTVHRVKPVTKGTRYSLVVWWLGEPYK